MSLKLLEEMEKRAWNKTGNLWSATVALLRERLLRWLGILAKNLSEKDKTKISREAFDMVSHLMRRRKLADIVRNQVRAIYPDFNPEQHYCKINRDKKGREKSRDYIPIKSIPDDLIYVRHVWHICEVHNQHVDRWTQSLELFADGLFEMTGTAIIQKMLDYTGTTNYAMDKSDADEIAGELFADEEEEAETEDTD